MIKKNTNLSGILFTAICCFFICSYNSKAQNTTQQARIDQVKNEPGLVAFWDFYKQGTYGNNQTWDSYYDANVPGSVSYPLLLGTTNDASLYGLNNWPANYTQPAYDNSGPLGKGVLFDRGYLFGEVPRSYFDGKPLNISGYQSFSMIAWMKFSATTDSRHGIAGIWDEGFWSKYSGKRQYCLFGGLFNMPKSTLCHISSTGASSYPQSNASGAQYARERSIHSRDVPVGEWHAVGATYDHTTGILTSYVDGVATDFYYADPVQNDVYKYVQDFKANTFNYNWPIYDPRAFVLKFQGYNLINEQEHWVYVDLKNLQATYGHIVTDAAAAAAEYRVGIIAKRNGLSLFSSDTLFFNVLNGNGSMTLPSAGYQNGDQIEAVLFRKAANGTYSLLQGAEKPIRTLEDGAPFVIGRAAGTYLASPTVGTTAYFDGVAVFNKALSPQKMADLSFINPPANYYIHNVKGINQAASGSGYAETIEVTYSGSAIPSGAQLKFNYQGLSVTAPLTGSPQQITLPNIPFYTGSFDTYEDVSVQILNSSNSVLTQWSGKRFFPAPRSLSQLISGTGLTQTISFGSLATKTYGDPSFSLNASASSGLTIVYSSSNTSVATVNGNTVTITGAGTTDIIASQPGNATYIAAQPVTQTLIVNKANQTISFGVLPTKLNTDPPFTLNATASSGLTVSYTSSNPAVATVSGNLVTITGVGTTTITASQAGNGNYNPATQVAQILTVTASTNAGCTGATSIAANKTYSASSFGWGNSAAKAFDGNNSTRWESNTAASGQWLQVNLNAPYRICNATIKWTSFAYATNFELKASSDGANWTTVHSKTGFTSASNGGSYNYTIDFSNTNISANYIRLVCLASGPGSWGGSYSVYELAINGNALLPGVGKQENGSQGIEAAALSEHAAPYPNPGKDVITLPFFKNGLVSNIEIYDNIGNIVKRVNLSTPDLYIGDLKGGIYYLRVSGSVEVYKIIKM